MDSETHQLSSTVSCTDAREMGVVPVVRNEMLDVEDGNENGTAQKPKTMKRRRRGIMLQGDDESDGFEGEASRIKKKKKNC